MKNESITSAFTLFFQNNETKFFRKIVMDNSICKRISFRKGNGFWVLQRRATRNFKDCQDMASIEENI